MIFRVMLNRNSFSTKTHEQVKQIHSLYEVKFSSSRYIAALNLNKVQFI